MLNVDGIESDDGCVEAHIELGQLVTQIVGSTRFGKVLFCAIERFEQSLDVLLIGFLCSSRGQ